MNITSNTNYEKLTIKQMSESEIDSSEDIWNGLLKSSASNSVFLRWEWIKSWLEVKKNDVETLILKINYDNNLIGIAPFCVSLENKLFKYRVIKFCACDDVYPDYMDIISVVGFENIVFESVVQYLNSNKCRWDYINLNYLLNNSMVYEQIRNSSNKYTYKMKQSSICPYLAINGTFDEFMLNNFRKKQRYNLLRQFRIAINENGYEICKINNIDDNGTIVDELYKLHLKRANSKNINSTINYERINKFYKLLTNKLAKNKMLNIYVIQKQHITVAIAYCILYNNKLYYLQSGIEPTLEKLSLGTVLLTYILKQAHDNNYIEFDFLKGDEQYKRIWTETKRYEYNVKIYNNNIKSKIYSLIDTTKIYFKNVLAR